MLKDPDKLPGNKISLTTKPEKEEKQIKQITTATRIQRRDEPLITKIVYNETTQSLFQYFLWDVIIPAFKATVSDMITGIPDFLFPDQRTSSRNHYRDRDRTYVSYKSYYGKQERERTQRRPRERSKTHEFDDILIADYRDAVSVLDQLTEMIDVYETASVADFYTGVGISPQAIDYQWGWDNLSDGYVQRVRGGNIIVLPRPFKFD